MRMTKEDKPMNDICKRLIYLLDCAEAVKLSWHRYILFKSFDQEIELHLDDGLQLRINNEIVFRDYAIPTKEFFILVNKIKETAGKFGIKQPIDKFYELTDGFATTTQLGR